MLIRDYEHKSTILHVYMFHTNNRIRATHFIVDECSKLINKVKDDENVHLSLTCQVKKNNTSMQSLACAILDP